MYPTASQRVLLDKHFGCARFVYNHFLGERIEQYKATHKSDNYFAQAKSFTLLKSSDEFSWLKEVNSQTLQYALKCVDAAYVNFFQRERSVSTVQIQKESQFIRGSTALLSSWQHGGAS